MADETKALDEFLGDLKNDGQLDPFKDAPEDPFGQTEEPKEPKEEPEEVRVEKSLPFHKDPKVQRFIEKEISKRMSEVIPAKEETPEENIDRRRLLEKIIGNDSPEKVSAVDELNKVFSQIEDKASKAEILYTQQREEVQAEKEAEDTLLNGIELVEETFGVDMTSDTPQAKREKARFIDSIRELAPKDENGDVTEYPDFVGAYKYAQSTRQSSNQVNRAKDLASRSSERGSNSEAPKQSERLSWDSSEWEKIKESF